VDSVVRVPGVHLALPVRTLRVTARKANWRFENMAHTQSLDHVPKSFHSAAFVNLRQSFPSQVEVISPFVDQLMRFMLHFRPADGSEIDIEMAMREALGECCGPRQR
jgi:hypothetical protein